jgi:hypothetical protein
MNTVAKYSLCIGAGVALEIVVFAAATGATFAGCGSAPLPAGFSFVFPFYALVPRTLSDSDIGTVVGYATLLQMPIYGAIIAHGWAIGKCERFALWILGVHLAIGIIGFFIQSA